MIIDEFLTMPPIWFNDRFGKLASLQTSGDRIIRFRFMKHLQSLSKIPPIPSILDICTSGAIITISKWNNNGLFMVGHIVSASRSELYSTVYKQDHSKDWYIHDTLDFLKEVSVKDNRPSILITNIFGLNIQFINSIGEQSELHPDTERLFRRNRESV